MPGGHEQQDNMAATIPPSYDCMTGQTLEGRMVLQPAVSSATCLSQSRYLQDSSADEAILQALFIPHDPPAALVVELGRIQGITVSSGRPLLDLEAIMFFNSLPNHAAGSVAAARTEQCSCTTACSGS
jgi:hypothetical protein